ncbi:di-trans,poly-cis-decaprenylcistransferase [Buchnera aphidicola (Pemphigus obesinymphae)]|uniref:polyprenyl diphosphate synthase n=1 Tax=Buchnera aphidicola TaxID=9 RepID=UPI0022388228|nr:polyprenyl diphosphate synthase [Buchnera aphidicola]MCW5196475.1 di-trans,poly-cis-decaprenylcistransferase [Buchnera aphidicola (Pemphigus obesinymphae)]
MLKCRKLLKKKLRHVAIIMDGNRRWAKNKGRFFILGYQEGIKAVHRTINFAILNRIEVLSLYAFSRENRYRPMLELKLLMQFFLQKIDDEIANFNRNNVCVKFIGDIKYFDDLLQKKIKLAEMSTINNNGLILIIAANYGGKWDIIEGIKKIIKKIESGFLHVNEIEESTLSNVLSTKDLAPVDLVIRTGGEYRISNFLLWQIAYSELYFTDVLWPDFNDCIFKLAIEVFLKRKRRFGS